MSIVKRFLRLLVILAGLVFSAGLVWAQGQPDPSVVRFAFLSAAIVMGMSAIGAGIAVAYIGAAAVGAMTEKPEVGPRALMYVGLAEGLAILGFAIAFLILGKV